MKRRIVIGLSAASGSGYGLELLKGLNDRRSDLEVELVYNDNALMIMKQEVGKDLKNIEPLVDRSIHYGRMDDPLASGSNRFDSMVICPCSSSTVGKIHSGIADNLMTRLASVALKEKRPLILVIRETPLPTPVLKAMYDLSSWGVVIMPASPAFYGMDRPMAEDLQRSLAGRILDILGLENEMTPRYGRD